MVNSSPPPFASESSFGLTSVGSQTVRGPKQVSSGWEWAVEIEETPVVMVEAPVATGFPSADYDAHNPGENALPFLARWFLNIEEVPYYESFAMVMPHEDGFDYDFGESGRVVLMRNVLTGGITLEIGASGNAITIDGSGIQAFGPTSGFDNPTTPHQLVDPVEDEYSSGYLNNNGSFEAAFAYAYNVNGRDGAGLFLNEDGGVVLQPTIWDEPIFHDIDLNLTFRNAITALGPIEASDMETYFSNLYELHDSPAELRLAAWEIAPGVLGDPPWSTVFRSFLLGFGAMGIHGIVGESYDPYAVLNLYTAPTAAWPRPPVYTESEVIARGGMTLGGSSNANLVYADDATAPTQFGPFNVYTYFDSEGERTYDLTVQATVENPYGAINVNRLHVSGWDTDARFVNFQVIPDEPFTFGGISVVPRSAGDANVGLNWSFIGQLASGQSTVVVTATDMLAAGQYHFNISWRGQPPGVWWVTYTDGSFTIHTDGTAGSNVPFSCLVTRLFSYDA